MRVVLRVNLSEVEETGAKLTVSFAEAFDFAALRSNDCALDHVAN